MWKGVFEIFPVTLGGDGVIVVVIGAAFGVIVLAGGAVLGLMEDILIRM